MNRVQRFARRRSPSPVGVALLAVLLAALGLRLFGLNWDRGLRLHPDELFIVDWVLVGRIQFDWPPDLAALVNPAVSGLNPRSVDPETGVYWDDYAYGALPLLVTDLVAEAVSRIVGGDWHRPDKVYLVGRSLSALFDTATVAVVYALGARIISRRAGLFGATIAALAPMSIQLAHFFTTDSWLTLFVALCLLAGVRAAESGTLRWFAAVGAAFGLAMASKGSVFTLAGGVAAAVAYDGWSRRGDRRTVAQGVRHASARLVVAGVGAVASFAVFEPYALLRPSVYVRAIQRQAEIVSGLYDAPYTRQYLGTTPVAYQLEQFVRWGFGPVAGLLALAGTLLLVRRFWTQRTGGQWIVVAWLLGYGLVISVAETKFLRYLAPLVPVLAVMAGLALDALWGALQRRRGRRTAVVALAVLLAGVALGTAAFESVYAHENTRLAASNWIYANVPSGSGLSHEYWDDTLPLPLGAGLTPADRQFAITRMDLYKDRAPEEAADEIFRTLEGVDYVVLSSNRVSSAVPRSPWRYPVQTRYYELLRNGGLGFALAAEFERAPSLGPLRFIDHGADESFINYDHPRVLIFRKEGFVSRPTYDRLMAWAVARPWSPTRYEVRDSLLLDEPVGERRVVADARWSEAVTGSSLGALAAWLGLLALLQVVGWPLASLVFGRFADAGWGLSRLVALVTSGYLLWIGASLRVVAFRAVWAAAALALVGGIGWVAFRRWRRRGVAWTFRRDQRRVAVGAEATFWVVFALFLLFRYLNPDGWHPIWGGEKPMEFAHLNATLRSAHFPPYDPWYADGILNYYYYGLYLVAFCLKLTGIPTEIGFNLAQPTLIALLASAGYSVAAALGRRAPRRSGHAAAVGAFGALLLVGIGNLGTLRRVLGDAPVTGNPFIDRTWWPSRMSEGEITITEFPFFTGLYADLHAHVVALPITILAIALCYAVASDGSGLAAALRGGGSASARAILGGRLALLALVLGTLSATNAWDVPVYAALSVVALVTGVRAFTTWPRRISAVVGLGAPLAGGAFLLFLPFFRDYVALFGSLASVRAPTPPVEVASHLGGLLAVASFGLVVALLPRHGRLAGLLREPLVPTAAAGGLLLVTIGLLSGAFAGDGDPPPGNGLVGGGVALAAVVLGVAAWQRTERGGGAAARARTAMRGGIVVAGAAIGMAIAADRVALAGFLAVGAAAAAVWLSGNGDGTRFAGALAAAGALVAAGTEVVVLADDLIATDWYRMNTVFKFYNQVWVLLALASAALVGTMLAEGRTGGRSERLGSVPGLGTLGILPRGTAPESEAGLRSVNGDDAARSARRRWSRAGLAVTGAVVAASLLYPASATVPRLRQRFTPDLGSGTLNALDWMDYGRVPVVAGGDVADLDFADDRAAIDWFNRNVEGSPVVAEASIGPYRCNGSRISIGTGLPTITGWERHQQQQRYPETLAGRVADVRLLYASPDPDEKREILDRYDVGYVVVGQLERDGIRVVNGNDCAAVPSPAGMAAFEQMVGTDLAVAFERGGMTVYRVLPVGPG